MNEYKHIIVRIKRITLAVLFSFLVPFSMNAQKRVVHGKIIAFNKIPIEKAEIKVKKTKTTVLSDSLGLFTIECQVKDRLSIKAAGFKTKWVKVKNQADSLIVNLKFGGSEKDIEEATGNGHIEKKKLIYAIDYLDAELFSDYGYTDVIEMIGGKFPGLRIVNNEIIIRGRSSFSGSNAALIVIDGMITDMNNLKSLPVTDVKSIKILKGGQAAIYGSRGSNGVVMITTKGNKTDKYNY